MKASLPTDAPLQLSQVLTEECEALHGELPPDLKRRVTEAATGPGTERLEDALALRQALYAHVHSLSPARAALCFSGGGIRSATFNLGVIQALAKYKLLDQFHYLSTVSGGGYIGAWLTAWIHRSRKLGRSGVTDVQDILNGMNSVGGSSPHGREPGALTWLRDFSNYLTPKLGMFSADSWTLYGTALRNLILNWLVLIPLMVASCMMPRVQIAAIRHAPELLTPNLLMWVGLVLAIPSLTYLHLYRPNLKSFRVKDRPVSPSTAPGNAPTDFGRQGWFILFSLVPLVLAAYCLTTAWAWHRNAAGKLSELQFSSWTSEQSFVVAGAAIHLVSWGLAIVWTLRGAVISGKGKAFLVSARWKAVEGMLVTASGAIGGFALWAMLGQTPSEAVPTSALPPSFATYLVKDYAEWYAAFAVPGFLGLFLLVATLFIGLTSRFTGDQEHEFWGRTGSWMLNAGITIGVMGAMIIFGPGWIAKAGTWTTATIGGAAGLLSLLGGFSAKTLLAPSDKNGGASWLTEYGVQVATPLFVMLIIIGLALGTSLIVKGWSSAQGVDTAAWKETGQLMPEPDPCEPWVHSLALHNAQLHHLLSLWALLVSLGMAMGWCVDVNKFSLHGFYRNRLIRAYLGASRTMTNGDVRRPNPLTGFDPADNLPMAELAHDDVGSAQRGSTPIQKPFHVVNIALNLVSLERLAWQQRKAQSFTVSPLHCGSWQDVGYRRSHEYGYNHNVDRAISLGTAMATSGAAASPNMGYHSSPAVAFLLALFNIRLGWWLGNPGMAGGKALFGALGRRLNLWPAYHRSRPAFSVGPLVAELFGFTDASRRYVYLSDGGHFENLGLYEMVLRRCRHIVVIDVGCDPDKSFQDLGNAIRKIRIDQGVDIELKTDMIKPQGDSRYSRWHHAIGSIRYDTVDPGAPVGILVYLKPSLTGEEPSDVQDYAAHHKAFPHEPTSDQFFDEAQFESYRRLGEHIATEVFRFGMLNRSTPSSEQTLSEVIERLQEYWVSGPPNAQGASLAKHQR